MNACRSERQDGLRLLSLGRYIYQFVCSQPGIGTVREEYGWSDDPACSARNHQAPRDPPCSCECFDMISGSSARASVNWRFLFLVYRPMASMLKRLRRRHRFGLTCRASVKDENNASGLGELS